MEPFIRPVAGSDIDAVYDICVRTADAGGDARGQYASDRLMGDLFAVPYVVLVPEHGYVLDDGTGTAVGYVLAAPDTARFAERYRDEWIPATADRMPVPPDPPATPDDDMLALHHHPEWKIAPEMAPYPAHLHIDLLPEWQGQGWGRRLMARVIDSLREAGVPAVHLAMLTSNVAARHFYDRLAFTEVAVAGPAPVTYLVRDTSPLD